MSQPSGARHRLYSPHTDSDIWRAEGNLKPPLPPTPWRLLYPSGSQTFAHISVTWRACENSDYWALAQEFLIQQVWSRACECAFPTSSQVRLLLQVRGPHLGNQRSILKNQGTSLVAQWLRIHLPMQQDTGSILGPGRSHMPRSN